ncbi:MAG: hypothetical protein E5X80_08195 [Mesorhizobium sp.]|uniref:DUF6894 family protein n=1 Tax=Mesorhizobium sp. TaxID=1871066 RepID=UPI0011FCE031|nr:hypothetical protein [Mesorhizobium sp.]TIO53861.1 MAG: hypothetical protein E5X78_05730 [Mesorhizobium sp.]TIO61489.1 MAG: hypothetical protein E5X79_06880 [Mesorhizobium sp.]TJV65875.1 MAG: hypothetical protein E5X80_08195 [Mesorhizobium sp.]
MGQLLSSLCEDDGTPVQVLETSILPKPEGVVVVEFLGEGGEKTAVILVASDQRLTPGGAALIDRAKAMMMQCAVFETTEALESNREFNEPTVLAMPESLFTFEYRNGDSVRQPQGVELANLEAVHEEALRSAIGMLDDTGGKEGWAVRVRDRNGKIVLSVDFDEAKQDEAAAE